MGRLDQKYGDVKNGKMVEFYISPDQGELIITRGGNQNKVFRQDTFLEKFDFFCCDSDWKTILTFSI